MNSPDGHYSNVTLHSNIFIDVGNDVHPLFVTRAGKLVFNPFFTEDVPDPTPTPSPSPTSTPGPTPTPTVSASLSPTPTASPTPTPTATDTSTPTPTATPTGTPESTPTPSPSPSPTETPERVVGMKQSAVVTVENYRYVFDDRDANVDKFALYVGDFTFKNVSPEHPIGFILTDGMYEVSGDDTKKLEKEVEVDGDVRKVEYWYGDVKLTISGDFGMGSYTCYYHGWMGGENRLKYDEAFKPTVEGLLGVSLDDTYNNSLFTGTKTLILQSVVANDVFARGTMYALTETPVPGAEYVLHVSGKNYYCVGRADAKNTYISDAGETKTVSWGYYYTVMISLDIQPIDIAFAYKTADGVYAIDYTVSAATSSETITFLPETIPSVERPEEWIQMTRGNSYEPVILAAFAQPVDNLLNLAAIEGSLDVGEKMPDVGFKVKYEEYAYNYVMYVTIKNDGAYVVELGDVLFVVDSADNVRGVSSTVITTSGVPMFVIQVYSNVTGGYENLLFKFMKHKDSVQLISDRLYDLDAIFISTKTSEYTQDAPLTFNFGVIEKKISGPYDWVSINVDSSNMNFMNVFSSFLSDVVAVRSKTAVIYKGGGGWIGDLSTLNTREFYIVKTAGSGPYDWKFDAKLLNTIDQPVIENGYNWISYPLTFTTDASVFVTNYIDNFKQYVSEVLSQKGVLIKSHVTNSWYGTLSDFRSNEGYIVNVKEAPVGETFVMKYPNSSMSYVKINNSDVIGRYTLAVSDMRFYYDAVRFEITSETEGKLTLVLDGASHVVTLNTTAAAAGAAVETWLDDSYVSLAPTRVEGEFPTSATTTMTTDEVVTIQKVRVVMSYTLELFSGEYILTMNGYLDFYGTVGTPDPMTMVAGEPVWLSQISGTTFKFTGTRDGSVTLPNTPTPTVTSNIITGPNAPVLQVLNKGATAEVYLNTNGQARGVASFQLEFVKPIFISGATMNLHSDKFTVSISDNKIIGVQMSGSPVEVTASTTTLMLTINLGSGSVAVLNAATSSLVDSNGDSLDMSSIRVAETPTPTPTTTTYPTPTPTTSADNTVVMTSDAPVVQAKVNGTNVEVYVNTSGQTSAFTAFQVAFNAGIIINGTPSIPASVPNGSAITLSNTTSMVMGMQVSATPVEFGFDVPTLFLIIPIEDASHASLDSANTKLTNAAGVSLDMSSITGAGRVLNSVTSAPGEVLGDVSGDGTCNISDVQLVINEIFNPGTLSAAQRAAADINQDSTVDVSDLQLVINIIFGLYFASTPTPSDDSVYVRVLSDGYELHANDDLSILYFSKNGDILLEILPQLGIEEQPITVPAHCAIMKLTNDWNIVYPRMKVSDISKMDIQFLYKGHQQGLVTPTMSAAMIRSAITASLYFSVSGSASDAFWALTTSTADGIKFWFREDLSVEWVSQIQVGSMSMAGYTSIVRKIDVDVDDER